MLACSHGHILTSWNLRRVIGGTTLIKFHRVYIDERRACRNYNSAGAWSTAYQAETATVEVSELLQPRLQDCSCCKKYMFHKKSLVLAKWRIGWGTRWTCLAIAGDSNHWLLKAEMASCCTADSSTLATCSFHSLKCMQVWGLGRQDGTRLLPLGPSIILAQLLSLEVRPPEICLFE